MDYIIAVRPWTLSASVIPVLVATAVCGIEAFKHPNFVKVLIAMVCVHAGANLINIREDFKRGVDNATLNKVDKVITNKLFKLENMYGTNSIKYRLPNFILFVSF